MNVALGGRLTGPRPWHVSGYASFDPGWWCPEIKIPFSYGWGSEEAITLRETENLTNILKKEIADDQGMLLLDMKDLRSMCQMVGDNASSYTTSYGNISVASIGAIQRGLLQTETQGGDKFFGEPMLNIADLMQTDSNGKGIVNILAADKLLTNPRVYASVASVSPGTTSTSAEPITGPSSTPAVT